MGRFLPLYQDERAAEPIGQPGAQIIFIYGECSNCVWAQAGDVEAERCNRTWEPVEGPAPGTFLAFSSNCWLQAGFVPRRQL